MLTLSESQTILLPPIVVDSEDCHLSDFELRSFKSLYVTGVRFALLIKSAPLAIFRSIFFGSEEVVRSLCTRALQRSSR